MNEETHFIKAILADPDAAEPRLVFADWLEEHGDPRAEVVRVQIKRREVGNHRLDLEQVLLDDEHAAVLAPYEDKWKARLPKIEGIKWGPLEGGLVHTLHVLDADSFYDHAEQILDCQPITHFRPKRQQLWRMLSAPCLEQLGGLRLPLLPDVGTSLAASTHLCNLRTLDLSWNELDHESFRQLVHAPHLMGLRSLNLFRARGLTAEAVGEIVHSSGMTELRRLDLGCTFVGAQAARELADDSKLPNLVSLDLSECRIGKAGLNALSRGGRLERLESLTLGDREAASMPLDLVFPKGDANLRRLTIRHAPVRLSALLKYHMPRLETLDIASVSRSTGSSVRNATALRQLRKLKIGGLSTDLASAPLASLEDLTALELHAEALRRLSGNESLENLQLLTLTGEAMTSAGLISLAQSPLCAQLRGLELDCSGLTDKVAIALIDGSSETKLRCLRLFASKSRTPSESITDATAIAIASSRSLSELTHLRLSRTSITQKGFSFLLESGTLKQLRSLDLSGPGLTDRHVEQCLEHLPNLTRIRLESSEITHAGMDAILDANHPNLRRVDFGSRTIAQDSKLFERYPWTFD